MPKNKYLLQIVFVVVLFTAISVGFSNSVHAQTQPFTYVPLAAVPNLTPAGTNGQAAPISPATYIQNLYVFAFSIGIVIAVVSGVWSGIEYMLSESITGKDSARKRISGVVWGFALLLSSYVILDLINPQLVTFNLNLGTATGNGNLTALLTAQQAAQQQLELTANNAVIASQQASQNLVSLKQKLTAAQATLATAQQNYDADTLAALAGGGSNITDAQKAADQAALTAAQSAVDSLQGQVTTAQSTAAQTAAAMTQAQATSNITKTANGALTNNLGTQTAPADAIQSITQAQQTADALLAKQAASTNDPAATAVIGAEKTVTDSTAVQSIALITALKGSTSNSTQYDQVQSVQSALTAITSAQTQINTLTASGQTAAAQSLQQTTNNNLTALNNYVTTNSGAFGGCASAAALSYDTSTNSVTCVH